MKFSELWLREWIDLDIDSVTLSEQITMAGMRVENIEPVSGYFTNVVIGHIIECRKHPNNKNFQIAKVNIGGGKNLNVICNKPNCRPDIRVAVATVDAVLPGKIEIKNIELLGSSYNGILCSFSELGINNNHYDIIELPKNAPIGQDIHDYLLLNDSIINISITPNRADCLGLLGIARDIAALNNILFVEPITETQKSIINDTLPIIVDAKTSCPCYLGRIIKNINVKTNTPLWMKEKLRRSGLQSINILSDIANYILIELGQPICVYDLNAIEGGIIVRYAKNNETITLLNNKKIILSSDTLVIADYEKILAIAGMSSGVIFETNSITHNIFLECAFFKPMVIIEQARRYNIQTDASHRYERGVDPSLQPFAIERATKLLISICGGQPGPVINCTCIEKLKQSSNIILRRKKLDQLTGFIISSKKVVNILTNLGCQIIDIKNGWEVTTPTWRFDLTIEEDLIEEIMRIYGYNAIPAAPIRTNLVMPFIKNESNILLSRVKLLLVDRGYNEIITYSLVNPKNQAIFHPQQKPVTISNPISQNMSVMRLSLWTGLLEAMIYNKNHQQKRIRLFESGLCFLIDKTANLGIRQELILAGAVTGSRFDEHWDQKYEPIDFYDIKGDLEVIFGFIGKLEDIKFIAQLNPNFHPGQSAVIYLYNEPIGFIGVLHPNIKKKLKLHDRVILFEILWKKITKCCLPTINNISQFPSNRRDISIIVRNDIPSADVITECKNSILDKLVKVKLFDVYKGENIKKGFKSLSIGLILQDINCTLKEKEIDAIVSRCVIALKTKFQAYLRN